MATSGDEHSALGYIHVSTTDQAERGQGLDIQRRGIRAYCCALIVLFCSESSATRASVGLVAYKAVRDRVAGFFQDI